MIADGCEFAFLDDGNIQKLVVIVNSKCINTKNH